jgi:hypothetical protein
MSESESPPPVLEPAAQAFAEATANPPYLFDLGPVEGRKTVDQVQSGEIVQSEVDSEDTFVPGGPSGQVSVRILRPKGLNGRLPVIIYLHGAGWVFGNAHTHDRLIRKLAAGADAAVVFPNYSLSPEARYPVAIEENFAVARWVAAHSTEHGLDSSRITFGELGKTVTDAVAAVVAAYGAAVAARLLPDTLPYIIGTPTAYGFNELNGRSLTDNAPDVMFSLATNTAFTISLTKDSVITKPTTRFPYVPGTA